MMDDDESTETTTSWGSYWNVHLPEVVFRWHDSHLQASKITYVCQIMGCFFVLLIESTLNFTSLFGQYG